MLLILSLYHFSNYYLAHYSLSYYFPSLVHLENILMPSTPHPPKKTTSKCHSNHLLASIDHYHLNFAPYLIYLRQIQYRRNFCPFQKPTSFNSTHQLKKSLFII